MYHVVRNNTSSQVKKAPIFETPKTDKIPVGRVSIYIDTRGTGIHSIPVGRVSIVKQTAVVVM